jgi:hypothetical protein
MFQGSSQSQSSGSDVTLDPNLPIHIPWAVGWFGSSVMSDSNGEDRDGPWNIGYFNQLLWLMVGQDFVNFSHCESFRAYVKELVGLWCMIIVPAVSHIALVLQATVCFPGNWLHGWQDFCIIIFSCQEKYSWFQIYSIFFLSCFRWVTI